MPYERPRIPLTPREMRQKLQDLVGPKESLELDNITVTRAQGSDEAPAFDVVKIINPNVTYSWRVKEVFDPVWERSSTQIEFHPNVPQASGGEVSCCTPRDPIRALDKLLHALKLPEK